MVCVCSARCPIRLRPSTVKASFAQVISKGLVAGPTACEAPLMLGSCSACGVAVLPSVVNTRAVGSARIARRPNGLTPLNVLLARPSQKLRKLNTALMLVGVLRGSTLRVLIAWPLTMIANGANGAGWHLRPWPAALLSADVIGLPGKAPCEDVTSLVSNRTGDSRSATFANRWNG